LNFHYIKSFSAPDLPIILKKWLQISNLALAKHLTLSCNKLHTAVVTTSSLITETVFMQHDNVRPPTSPKKKKQRTKLQDWVALCI